VVNPSEKTLLLLGFPSTKPSASEKAEVGERKSFLSTFSDILLCFLGRRFFRVVPAYAVLGVASYLVFYLDDCHYCERETERCNEFWWSNVLFLNNFTDPMCLTWTWSIAVEWHMYLISPFLVLYVSWSPQHAHKLLYFLTALSAFLYAGLNVYVWVFSPESNFVSIVYTRTYTRMFAYFYGMIAATYVQEEKNYLQALEEGRKDLTPMSFCFFFQAKDPRQSKTFGSVLKARRILVTLGLLVTLFIPPLDPFIKNWIAYLFLPVFCLFVAYILYDLMSPLCTQGLFRKVLSWVLSSRILFVISQLSYGMYLIHVTIMFPVFDRIGKMMDAFDFNFLVFLLAYLLFVLLSGLVSLIVYFVIEKPMINLAQMLFSKKPKKI